MKLSYEDWIAVKNKVEEELKLLTGTNKEPNAEFSELGFSWDYHCTYPPGKVRLHFKWKGGVATGWRTRHWDDSPLAPVRILLGEGYLTKVFDVKRLGE